MKLITGMSVILTEGCNLSCSYCYEKKKSPKVMTVDTVKKAIDFLFANSANEHKLSVIWFGGEPMTNFDVLVTGHDYLHEQLKKEGREVDELVITNGTIWNDKINQFFVDNPDVRLQLSWDGMPEFQDKERGQSGKVLETLELMKKLSNHLTAHIQVTPSMVPKLLENVDYAYEKMGNKFRVTLRPIPEVEGWLEDGVLDTFNAQLSAVYDKYGEKIDKIENCEHAIKSTGTCGAGKNFGSVTPDGDIYACHRFYFQNNRDFKVGNIEEGFVQTVKTQLLEEYTRDNISGCAECDAFELCDRCVAANFGETYDILIPSDSNCGVGKAAFFSMYNWIKKNHPWMTNYEPQPITKIAALPDGMSDREAMMNYLLPMIYSQQETINFLQDQLYKLTAKIEYNEKRRRENGNSATKNKFNSN